MSYATNTAQEFYNGPVSLEDDIPAEAVEGLKALGHKVDVVSGFERIQFGKGQCITKKTDERTGKTVWTAGSDPRSDGVALPLL